MDVLITYDIDTTTREGERRLARVARVCERYGTRVQDSVFECRLGETAVTRLLLDLREVIDADEDSVHIYRFEGPLPPSRVSLGRTVDHEPGRPWIL